jgi:hypothetical protein
VINLCQQFNRFSHIRTERKGHVDIKGKDRWSSTAWDFKPTENKRKNRETLRR